MILRLAWKEISNNRRFSLFFVFNLLLGLYGFVALNAFKQSIEGSLAERAKSILTADLSISSRRAFTPEENRLIAHELGSALAETRVQELYSMVARPKGAARLVQVVAIEAAYPFYGQIQLRAGGTIDGSRDKKIVHESRAWIFPDLETQLGVHVGDPIKIGDALFSVEDIVTQDAGSSWLGFSLAPRVYIGLPFLASTHLIGKGSTLTYRRLFRLPPGQDPEALGTRLNARLNDPGIRVTTPRKAMQQVGRLQGFLNDYLGLAALVSLFLAGLGAAYLFRSFLARRQKEIAILLSLGLAPGRAQQVYVAQLALLGAVAGTLAAVSGVVSLPIFIRLLSHFLAYPVRPIVRLENIALALGIGVVGSLLLCFPFLRQIRRVRPLSLFQADESEPGSWKETWTILPALLFYWSLSVWQARSWKVGSLFVGSFTGAGFLLILVGALVLWLLGILSSHTGLRFRLALRQLSRNRASSLSCFLALALGALLLNLIPQIQQSLESDLVRPDSKDTPSLFLSDIQEDQVEPLHHLLSDEGLPILGLSPLIRGRLESINGHTFEKIPEGAQMATREREEDERMRNRGFNLSTRAHLSAAEQIVAGHDFSGPYSDPSQPAEISVEKWFAKRLRLKLGDVMQFDVEGIPVSGRIINIRDVRWTSFQPNFFVEFQPGAIDAAPKTFLASVPELPAERRIHLQNKIVARFPNISIFDVTQIVSKILSIYDQMGWAIRTMAALSLFAGFVVLFSIANHQALTRQAQTSLLKVLGASFSSIQAIFAMEFGVLASAAAFSGTALSFAMSDVLSRWVFDGLWEFRPLFPMFLIGVVSLLSVAVAVLATRRALRQSPLLLLQDGV